MEGCDPCLFAGPFGFGNVHLHIKRSFPWAKQVDLLRGIVLDGKSERAAEQFRGRPAKELCRGGIGILDRSLPVHDQHAVSLPGNENPKPFLARAEAVGELPVLQLLAHAGKQFGIGYRPPDVAVCSRIKPLGLLLGRYLQ